MHQATPLASNAVGLALQWPAGDSGQTHSMALRSSQPNPSYQHLQRQHQQQQQQQQASIQRLASATFGQTFAQPHPHAHSPTLSSTTANTTPTSAVFPVMMPQQQQQQQHAPMPQLQQMFMRQSQSPAHLHHAPHPLQQHYPEASTSSYPGHHLQQHIEQSSRNVSMSGADNDEESNDGDGDGGSSPGPTAGGSGLSARDKRAHKKGTKRPRPTLSCTECVRRKSKCDRVIPCSTCIKRGTPEKCKVDDEGDRPSQPFAQARELQAVKDRVAKLEQLLVLLAPDYARALGIASTASAASSPMPTANGSATFPSHLNLNLGLNFPGQAGRDNRFAGPQQSVSPAATTFAPIGLPGGASTPGTALTGLPWASAPSTANTANGPASKQPDRQPLVKQQSDSDLDDDEENEDGREAEKAAFALESIAVAGRPNNTDAEITSNLPMTSQARAFENQLRQQEADFLTSMLPPAALSRSLVDAFFNKVAWQNHIVHVPTFEAQYAAMRKLVEQHRTSEIDPAWLSLYFMVLACGLFYSPNRPDMPPSHQAEYTHTWVVGAQRALQLADWSGKPQLTCIQAVVLFPIVLMHAGGIKRLASWIAAALRMAQLLDLHKLDDESGKHKQSSNAGALSPGASSNDSAPFMNTANAKRPGPASTLSAVEREIGKRLYFSLTHGEVNFASRWLGLGSNPDPHHHAIPHLLNVDDAGLLEDPPVSKPIEVATASSFQVIRARTTMQDFNARLTGSDARAHKYETVLAFDQRTRELLDQLPAYFKYDRSDDPDIKAIVQQRPYIAYQRCVILYGLNNRLLRAHRPFMSRGYQDPKYAYSTESCIKAAKVIIAAQRALRDIFDAADRMYNCLLYCFSSAVVLLVDNFHKLGAEGAISDTSNLDAQRHEALDVLHMLRREANTSTIAAAGTKVLEGLLNEEGHRRVQQGLPPAAEDFTRNNTPDSDPANLREVVGRIASVSQHSKPVTSPTNASPPSGAGHANDQLARPTRSASNAAPFAQMQVPMGHFSAPVGQPSRAVGLGGNLDPSLSMPPSQTFLGSALGDTLMGGDESEDLLRSLGFFEVTGSGMGNTGQSGSAGAFNNTIFGGSAGLPEDLGWLDGLGEW